MVKTGTECMLLFVKSPEKGKVKSRLSEAIGEEMALALYKHFVLDTVATLKKERRPFKVCFYPADSREMVVGWLGNGLAYMPQLGEDLGKRMENAFHQIFSEGFSRAIIIGSDIPDLPVTVLHEALESLKTSDAVIGPAVDGGYYLIGFRADTFLPDVFDGQAWSTDSVFGDTMALFERSAYRVHRLPEWRDVDTFEDLKALLVRTETGEFGTSGTMKYLIHNRREIFNE
jgi:rSAM/selenodomain-associated transferase 1